MMSSSGGYDISRFVALDPCLAKHLTCSICLDILKSPMETKCRHTFCDHCIRRWLQTNNECPVCKTIVSNWVTRSSAENSLEVNLLAKNIINDLKYKCYSERNGCQKPIEIQFLASHLEECDEYRCHKCGLKMGKKDDHNCVELMRHELFRREADRNALRTQVLEMKRKLNESEEKSSRMEREMNRFKFFRPNDSSSGSVSHGVYVRRDLDFENIDCYEELDENPYALITTDVPTDDTFRVLYLRDGSNGHTMRHISDVKVRIRLDSKFHTLLPLLRQKIGYRNGKITFYDTMGHVISLSNTPRNSSHRLKDSLITFTISYN